MHDVGMATVAERQCGLGLCVYLLGFFNLSLWHFLKP